MIGWAVTDSAVASHINPWGDGSVQEYIARENIRRFEEKLESCTDPEQRKILERLLADEQGRLKEARVEKDATRKKTG